MEDRIDRLTGLLHRFGLSANVLHGGVLRGALELERRNGFSHLHVLRHGAVELTDDDGTVHRLSAPSAVFFPRAVWHRIVAAEEGTEVLCAAVDFGSGDENPLLGSLPPRMCVPAIGLSALDATLGVFFLEASARRCGHSTVLDRLTEVLFVQLMRYAIEHRLVEGGVVAGLADVRLARALTAMHEDPARSWSLAQLAATAGMSRSRFAARFTEVVGVPAMAYLTRWRIGVAQGLLRRGRPSKVVAQEVGYGRSSTFGRAFAHVVGTTPTSWLRFMDRQQASRPSSATHQEPPTAPRTCLSHSGQ
jgi:AraC-like DNA-binding protein